LTQLLLGCLQGDALLGNLFQAGKLYSVFCSEEEGISTSSGLFRTRL
jgi:hypothetical protein